MAANRIYLQVDLNSDSAQQNVNALNQSISQIGPKAEKSSTQATTGLNKVSVSVESVTSSFSSMGAALAGLGIERVSASLLKLSSDFSRIQLAMTAFTGNAQQTKELLEDIRQIARGGIFEFKDLAQEGRRMLAFGIAAENVRGYLNALSDQAAATGASMEDLSGIVSLTGRIMEKDSVGAMDLLRKLPQQAIPIMAALRKQLAEGLGKPFGDISPDDVKEAIKNGILEPLKTVNTVYKAVEESGRKLGQQMKDGTQAFKDLGDEIKVGAAHLGQAFDPAIVKLAGHIEQLLVPLEKFANYLESLPEDTKEWIVDITAAAAVLGTMAVAIGILGSVLGPVWKLMKLMAPLAEGIGAAFAALAAPEVLAAIGLIATTFGLLYKFMPGVKEFTDSTIDSMTKKFKGMFETVHKEANKSFAVRNDPSSGIQESEEILKKQRELMGKLQDEAAESLLQAYASPMEAIMLKYATLFRELNKQIEDGAIEKTHPEHAAELRGGLSAAQRASQNAELVKQRKQDLDQYVSEWTEKVKGSTDAQIAYIEAQDAQSLRGKLSAIDKITALRIEAEDQVAKVQKEKLRAATQDFVDFVQANQAYFKARGLTDEQIKGMTDTRRQDDAKKVALIDQKAFDETQKYRLEGWKKANDVIIEDQKRVYDAFRDIWDNFFDAITGKAGNVGKAIGDMFKKLAIGELKETFANQMAGLSTELAGYGRPEESQPQHGQGLLGILLRRGTPPRPLPMAAPEAVGGIPGIGSQKIDWGSDWGAGMSPVAPIIESGKTFEVATAVFAAATDRFATAIAQQTAQGTVAQTAAGPTGLLSAPALQAPAGLQGYFAQAYQKYSNLPPGILEAVAKTESGFRPGATSGAGAVGVMQLMAGTARDLGVTDRTDAGQSIDAGAHYLSQQLTRFGGDPVKAIAAYNAGPGRVARGGALPAETQAYVPKVMALMQQYAGTQAGPASVEGMAGLPAAGSVAATPQAAQSSMQMMMGLPPAVTQPTAAITPVNIEQLAGLPMRGSGTQFAPTLQMPDSVTVSAMPPIAASALGTSEFKKAASIAALGLGAVSKAAAGGKGGAGGLAGLGGNLNNLKSLFGIGIKPDNSGVLGGIIPAPSIPGQATTARSVLTSQGTGMLLSAGGLAAASYGLQKRNTTVTTLGGAAAGLGMLLQNPKLFAQASAQGGGAAGAVGAGLAVGAGAGLFASGLQKGGGLGFGLDVAGGALAGAGIGFMFGGPMGAAIGAGIGAAAGAVAGAVRLLIKTETEKIRAQIKQVYGIDISNVQLLNQIKQVIDQSYGGNVAVGIRSQQVQDIVRLYALSTGQAAGLPRPEYSATIAQSAAGGNQLQQVYQGGQLVQNPYSGTTTYQYQSAVTTAQGLNAGTSLGVPGATGIVNQVIGTLQSNPAAVANSSAAAARAGDSRMTTSAAMLEPLTSLS